MPRYADWFRKVGDTAASPRALDAAKKLLGYLNIRRGTPGVDTLVQKVMLDDGTVVTAAFYGDQPTVTVDTSAVGGETCTLYVESGMLDLGPNIASDANNRFNRGLPEFDDRPATLYFGDGVDCQQGQGGFNGRIKVRGKTITSDCLPKQGNSVESRLRDPVKKQAQALFPASCWSGLMQRYVQAVYGGDALEYSATASTLTIAGVDINAEASLGLVAVGGFLGFVEFDAVVGVINVRACAPKSRCFDACIALWRAMPSGDDEQRQNKQKVLSIALSGCKIGKSIKTIDIGVSGNKFFQNRPVMHFSDEGDMAALVVETGGTASAYKVTFSMSQSGLEADVAVVSSSRVFADQSTWPMFVAGVAGAFCGNAPQQPGFESDGATLAAGSSYDYPVYALCAADGSVSLVRYTIAMQSQVIADADVCINDDIRPTNYGPDAPCSTDITGFIDIVSGYYCQGSSVTWSSVMATALIEKNGKYVSDVEIFTSKSLAVVPIGDEYITSESVTRYNTTISASGNIGHPQAPVSDDCISGSAIVASTASAPAGACSYSVNVIFGACIGHSSGTGFPVYLSESTCGYVYMVHEGSYSANCTHYSRRQDSTVYTLYASGELHKPRPDVISMCGGSYEFVVDRYILDMADSLYYSKESAWTDGEGRYSCTFSASFDKLTPTSGTLCDPVPHTIDTPEGDFSGTYESQFEGFELLKRAPFINWSSQYEAITNGVSMRRGKERFVSVSSYGEVESIDGSICLKSSEDSAATYTFHGVKQIKAACPYAKHLQIDEIENKPISTVTSASNGEKRKWVLAAPDLSATMVGGFRYACAKSLIGARITQTIGLDRGESVGMDRQTITGGYPKVSTPSFVGWA